MDHIFIRPAPLLREEFEMREWLGNEIGRQLFDPDTLNHASTFRLCAFDGSGPLAYLPVQQPLMLESVGWRPGLTEARRAMVLRRITEHMVAEAYRRQRAEIYFLSQDPATSELAMRHHWKPVRIPAYRINLRELESGA